MKSTSDENTSSVYVKYLFASTLIYVLLPTLLFLGGWLKWYWAIPAVAIWITITARTIMAEFRGPVKDTPALGMNYLQIPIIAAYITYSSGVGSFVGQCANYVVWDNLKLYDLIVHPWPVVYPEKQAFYCYYVGYFLPIAALTKIASNLNLAEYFSFVWAWLGVTLCLFWVFTIMHARYAWMVVIFVLTGGLSAFVTFFNTLDPKFLRFGEDISYPYTFISTWWAGKRTFLDAALPYHCTIRYASTATTMAWAPYHYISGILFPAVIWYKTMKCKSFRSLPLIMSVGLIWSPFVLIGLIPFVLYAVVKDFKNVLTPETFISLIPALAFLAYFAAHTPTSDMVSGVIWNCGSKWWFTYLSFVLIEVGIFTFFVVALRKQYLTKTDILAVKLSLIPLVLFPLFYLGFYNDFPVKAGIAPLFFLTITFAKLISRILEELIHKGRSFFKSPKPIVFAAILTWMATTIIPTNILLHPLIPHPLYTTKTSISKPFVSDTIRNLSEHFLSNQFLGDLNHPLYPKIFKELPVKSDRAVRKDTLEIKTE